MSMVPNMIFLDDCQMKIKAPEYCLYLLQVSPPVYDLFKLAAVISDNITLDTGVRR